MKDCELIIGEDLGISFPWNIKNDLKCNMSEKVCFFTFDYPVCPLNSQSYWDCLHINEICFFNSRCSSNSGLDFVIDNQHHTLVTKIPEFYDYFRRYEAPCKLHENAVALCKIIKKIVSYPRDLRYDTIAFCNS